MGLGLVVLSAKFFLTAGDRLYFWLQVAGHSIHEPWGERKIYKTTLTWLGSSWMHPNSESYRQSYLTVGGKQIRRYCGAILCTILWNANSLRCFLRISMETHDSSSYNTVELVPLIAPLIILPALLWTCSIRADCSSVMLLIRMSPYSKTGRIIEGLVYYL